MLRCLLHVMIWCVNCPVKNCQKYSGVTVQWYESLSHYTLCNAEMLKRTLIDAMFGKGGYFDDVQLLVSWL